ncbi:hypothetical protein EJB05_24835 [Eragrostis curvula]|uniref:Uncharacterized protein n=1 Tax=Eragrostis curvula TaxID=38414 RepID=A0A5J9VC85_9POAL|nr:hypothetical protein EJB05_24835 [Eragrostis curvula]
MRRKQSCRIQIQYTRLICVWWHNNNLLPVRSFLADGSRENVIPFIIMFQNGTNLMVFLALPTVTIGRTNPCSATARRRRLHGGHDIDDVVVACPENGARFSSEEFQFDEDGGTTTILKRIDVT